MAGAEPGATERLSKALRLRAQHYTYEQIAVACGYANRSGAYKAIQKALKERTNEDVDALRREELLVLDELQRRLWEMLEDEKYAKSKLFVVDRILNVMRRRAKLMGLDRQPDQQPDQQPLATIIIEQAWTDEHDGQHKSRFLRGTWVEVTEQKDAIQAE
jgi:hypothetical protein